ncbi:hypothetical protein [Devosia sp.]|uniref:hypothetical protein n=1 Tax=Devosia sp. TaxID=1871048 RepID=UPI001B275055|nr:hypothetical protein [Devosia sp.]MBO9589087.1 hypothetical protein [Devosia sp.]
MSASGIRRAKRFPSDFYTKIMLRLPGDLAARVKGHASINRQSINSTIVIALEAAYPAPVEPESVNQRLLESALILAGQWSAALESMGVDPAQHPALQKFFKDADEAVHGREEVAE